VLSHRVLRVVAPALAVLAVATVLAGLAVGRSVDRHRSADRWDTAAAAATHDAAQVDDERHSDGEPPQVFRARHFERTERAQVRGRELHVEQADAGGEQRANERDQRHLRHVGRAVEHRLGGEQPADLHAVQALLLL
jgi:hypothetical protein